MRASHDARTSKCFISVSMQALRSADEDIFFGCKDREFSRQLQDLER